MPNIVPTTELRATAMADPSRIMGVAYAHGFAPEEGADFREILAILRRRWKAILGVALLLFALAAAVVLTLKPRYMAEAVLLIESRKTQVVDITAVVSGLSTDATTIKTEAELLKSPVLAEKVVKKLNLTAVPEFNSALRPPSLLSRLDPLALVPDKYLIAIGLRQPKRILTPAETQEAQLIATTDTLLSRIGVVADGRSNVIKVHVDSEDPQLAAAIANALCAAYLEQQQEIKTEATEHANKWLSERLTTLRKKAEDSARAVQAFKQAHNLTQTKGLTVSQQQLSELNSQLTLAAAARADKEASLHQLQDMLKTPGGADSAAPVLASPLIEKLQEQLATVRRTRAELGTRYLSQHPAMIEARAQEHDLEKKIQTEVAKIVRAKESEAAAARAHEAMLRKQVHDLLGANAKLDTLSVQLDSLQHDADASNALYEDFLSRYKETSAQTDLDVPDARVAAAASPPASPHFPKTRLFLGIAGMIALTIGVVAAFLLERLDNGLRSADQLERLASLNTLGLTPAAGSGAALLEAVVRDPLSLYTEAIRTIRSSLHYSHIENPPKILLVTSSLPGEGKTIFATSLARSVARSGEKVLLVDCDLRQPNVGRYFGVADETAGLTTIFEESGRPDRSIFLDKPSGLHVVPSGRLVSNPQDLLRSPRMSDFLESKRDLYDLIVLDAPPVLAVSDALILSHLADATIFVVQWERTPRQAALGALKILRGGQGHIAGAVISQVNVRRHALYGYSDVGHYYGRYRNRRKAA